MKIAVLGTGMVGQAIGSKLVELGHDVAMGSRSADNPKAVEWAQSTDGSAATFNDACIDAELIFNCTNGEHSIDAIGMINKEIRDGKVLIDVANELAFENGKLESLASASNSLGKKIQDVYPELKVVKSLNTLNAYLMVQPSLVPGNHNIFLSGNDAQAKELVSDLFTSFGWKPESIIDLGGIDTAVGPEMYMGFWVTLYTSGKFAENGMFNVNIVQ